MGGREGEIKKRMQTQKHIQAKTRVEWNEANNWAGQGSFLLVSHHLAKIYFLALIDSTPHNRRTTEQSLLASPTTSSMLCKRAIPCRKFWKTGEAISLSNPCAPSCLTYPSQKIYFLPLNKLQARNYIHGHLSENNITDPMRQLYRRQSCLDTQKGVCESSPMASIFPKVKYAPFGNVYWSYQRNLGASTMGTACARNIKGCKNKWLCFQVIYNLIGKMK